MDEGKLGRSSGTGDASRCISHQVGGFDSLGDDFAKGEKKDIPLELFIRRL